MGFDVDVDEFSALGVVLDRPGMAVGEAVADGRARSRFRRRCGCRSGGWSGGPTMPAISGWSSGMTPQPMSVGMTGTPVVSANCTSRSEASALMMPPPATISGFSAAFSIAIALLDLGVRRLRFVGFEGLVGLDVELDLGELHVDRKVDQHRAGTAGAHQVEGLLESPRHQSGPPVPVVAHLVTGRAMLSDIDRLKVLLVQLGGRRLAGDCRGSGCCRRRRRRAR